MNPMMKALLPLVLLVNAPVSAQPPDDAPLVPEERLQEIKAQKVAYLTQKMDLGTDEAQKFWPVYNAYDKELEALRKERRTAHKEMKAEADLTEAEASAAIDAELASQQKELDLRKRYSAEFKKTIGARKTLALARAERDFNRELLKRMRERDGGRNGGPPGDRPRR